MFELTIPARELWDEQKECFVYTESVTLQLEHSLHSLSKWESKWHKPFLENGNKTMEETVDYIRCMALTPDVDPSVYGYIDSGIMAQVAAYIEDPMTATWISSRGKSAPGGEIITAELVYYWMVALNIPLECQTWHLNRLFTLIRVCNAKSKPAPKLGKNELARRNTALNAARRKKLRSKG